MLEQLTSYDQFEDLTFEVRPRQIDLAQFGAKGKAYRLTVTGVVGAEEAI